MEVKKIVSGNLQLYIGGNARNLFFSPLFSSPLPMKDGFSLLHQGSFRIYALDNRSYLNAVRGFLSFSLSFPAPAPGERKELILTNSPTSRSPRRQRKRFPPPSLFLWRVRRHAGESFPPLVKDRCVPLFFFENRMSCGFLSFLSSWDVEGPLNCHHAALPFPFLFDSMTFLPFLKSQPSVTAAPPPLLPK